jgi:hypothetical protein
MRMFDTDLTMLHNTFTGSNGQGPSMVLLRTNGDLRYNIFDSQQVAMHAFDNSVIDEDYNLFVGNTTSASNGGVVNAGGNSIDGDPKFAPGSEDFRLDGVDSDARDLAEGSTTLVDFEGDLRPIGLVADAGYDESPFANPVANGGGPHVLNEGTSLALDGAASSDEDNATTLWSWDCTNDGVFEHNAAGPTGNSCPFADNGSFVLLLRIEDETGLAALFTTTVTVNNVAPTVTSATAQSATTGQSKAFSLGSFTDPGPDAPWEVRINWGDGGADSVFDAAATGAIAPQNHTFAAAGVRTVTVTVKDKDGGAQSKTFQVTVTDSGNGGSPTPETPTPETPTPEATPFVYLPAIQGK